MTRYIDDYKGWKCLTDIPLASLGLTSYRYRGRYGWIMIGAKSDAEALSEARRSTDETVHISNLQVWRGEQYEDVVSV